MTIALPERSSEPAADDRAVEVDQVGVACATARGPFGRFLARQMGLPANGCVSARLRIAATGQDDALSPTHWFRTFGSVTTRTTVALDPSGHLVERVGLLTLHFGVTLCDERLSLDLVAVEIGGRRLDPRRMLNISAVAAPSGVEMLTTVEIDAGRFGHLTYTATMRLERAA